ncbi:Pectinesterase [Hypsizygus marmoreus]|uniref:pectinesterase n=1 Tax=Hypsizygus marmoreus TaxID=39966 RepID=A0A369J5M7_HYPMA|nr:Pectinesterase [Hypsizygus marmoreus]
MAVALTFCRVVLAATRTLPPSGAIVVRAGTTATGEYKTVASAVATLPDDSSSRSILYTPEHMTSRYLRLHQPHLKLLLQSGDDPSRSPASSAGSNDASGTLRIHKNDFKMYNVNVKNAYGPKRQAVAISQYGSRVGFYACGFYGYQDTLYANAGTQGTTDFIFGGGALAFFGGNTIGVSGPGWVTASGRESNDAGSYVFDKNTIVLASGAASDTSGKAYFGRPWGAYAKVILVWNVGDERTGNAFFGEYNSSGGGVSAACRPSFATVLSASQAASYSISSAFGSDYANWVDTAYL